MIRVFSDAWDFALVFIMLRVEAKKVEANWEPLENSFPTNPRHQERVASQKCPTKSASKRDGTVTSKWIPMHTSMSRSSMTILDPVSTPCYVSASPGPVWVTASMARIQTNLIIGDDSTHWIGHTTKMQPNSEAIGHRSTDPSKSPSQPSRADRGDGGGVRFHQSRWQTGSQRRSDLAVHDHLRLQLRLSARAYHPENPAQLSRYPGRRQSLRGSASPPVSEILVLSESLGPTAPQERRVPVCAAQFGFTCIGVLAPQPNADKPHPRRLLNRASLMPCATLRAYQLGGGAGMNRRTGGGIVRLKMSGGGTRLRGVDNCQQSSARGWNVLAEC